MGVSTRKAVQVQFDNNNKSMTWQGVEQTSRTKKGDCKVLTVSCVLWNWLKVSHLICDSINYWKCCVMDQSSIAMAGAMGIRNKRSSGDLTVFLSFPSLYNNYQKAHPPKRFVATIVCRRVWYH